MARVLILRQQPEAARTAEAVRALGHEPVVLPLAESVPLGGDPPADAFGAFVATSLQAAPALARHFPGDPRPVLCTGERTRFAFQAAGFAGTLAGPGTAAGLADAMRDIARATGLPLLYAAGRVRTPDLERAAAAAGTRLRVWEVYDIRPIRPREADIAEAFSPEGPSHVLVLSTGQAAALSALWPALWPALRGEGVPSARVPKLLCLSERISRALSGDLRPFARISPQPTLSSLFDRHLRPSFGSGGFR